MALKAAGYEDIYGIDSNLETLRKAKELGLIKEGYVEGKEIVGQADLIIISLYPRLVKNFIEKNKDYLKRGAIITDATGIKEHFVDDILSILPDVYKRQSLYRVNRATYIIPTLGGIITFNVGRR